MSAPVPTPSRPTAPESPVGNGTPELGPVRQFNRRYFDLKYHAHCRVCDTSLIDVDVQPLLVRALVKVRRRRAHALSDMSACMHARAPGLR